MLDFDSGAYQFKLSESGYILYSPIRPKTRPDIPFICTNSSEDKVGYTFHLHQFVQRKAWIYISVAPIHTHKHSNTHMHMQTHTDMHTYMIHFHAWTYTVIQFQLFIIRIMHNVQLWHFGSSGFKGVKKRYNWVRWWEMIETHTSQLSSKTTLLWEKRQHNKTIFDTILSL